MNKKIIQTFFVLIFLSACSTNLENKDQADQSQDVETIQTKTGACEIKKVTKVVDGNSMSPLLKNGEEVSLLENYYKCGKDVQKGDIVAYHYGGDERPLIKVVRVSSEDDLEIVGKKIHVNGEVLKNSADQEYIFSDGELKMLKLYIKDKRIPQKTYFLFGDNIDISTDSRKFGAVSPNDFLGKFEI